MKTKKLLMFLLVAVSQLCAFSQDKKPFILNENSDTIVMTWNKNTPEAEMIDDCKALLEKGITIKYFNVKRNKVNEITGLKVEYSDRQGNKGSMELDNQKPINTIQFFKQDGEIGFGQSSASNDLFAGNDIFKNFGNSDEIIKQFKFQIQNDSLAQGKFDFIAPENQKLRKSKIIIQNSGKKPLVIEGNKVVEGGNDYTKEEIDAIIKHNQEQQFIFSESDAEGKEFDFRNKEGLDNFKN